jgi:hypothetical protein
MPTAITTRQTGTTGVDGVTRKDVPLNNTEIDNNFISLSSNKLERSNNLSDLTNLTTARSNLGVALGSDVQAYDSDLAALSSLTTTGILVRTGTGSATTRSLTGATNEVIIGNADGIAGDVSVTLGSNIPRLNASSNVFSGDITAANLNSSSDMRLKHSVAPIENALETVRKLEGKSFTWIKTGKDSFGVMAQELELVIPQLVQEEQDEKSVNYLGLIAFLINAVKQLDKEIELLKNK